MANPFTSMLESIGLLPSSQPEDPWAAQVTPEAGVPSGQPPTGVTPVPMRSAEQSGYGQAPTSVFGFNPISALLGPSASHLEHLQLQRERQDYEERAAVRNATEAQKTNSAIAPLLQEAARIRQENPDLPSHEVTKRVLMSKAFSENFHRFDADKIQTVLDKVAQSTQVPPLARAAVGAGQANIGINPTTGQVAPEQTVSQPEAHVQGWRELLKYSPEQLAQLEAGERAVQRQQPDNKAAALARMVKTRQVTPETADAVLAGVYHYQSVPLPNGGTHTTIFDARTQPPRVVWDSSMAAAGPPQQTAPPTLTQPNQPLPGVTPPAGPATPQGQPQAPPAQPAAPRQPGAAPQLPPGPGAGQPATQLPAPQGPSQAPQTAPQGTPANPLPAPPAKSPDEPYDARRSLLNDGVGGASMFDSVGGLRGGVTAIGRLTGNIPGLASFSENASAKRDALFLYNHALSEQLKEGRELKGDLAARTNLMPNLNGLDANPLSEINKAVAMQEQLLNLRANAATRLEARNADGSYRVSQTQRAKLQDKVDGIDSVLLTLPSREQLVQQAGIYKASKFEDVFKGLPPRGVITDEASKALRGTQNVITPQPPAATTQPQVDSAALRSLDINQITSLLDSLGGKSAPESVKAVIRAELARRQTEGAAPSAPKLQGQLPKGQ